MKYKIIKFNEDRNCFDLLDPDGNTHRVDLFVSESHTGFGQIKNLGIDKWRKKIHSFTGKFVEIERLHPYEEIANNVRLLKSNSNLS
jgi:hypothetical protein